MYTVGSLFSGIGGLDLAAHWAGFTTSWFVEREPFCQKILAKHWPDVPCHSDVFEAHDLPHVDIVVGGFPCQPFSVAGNRKGADDERYLLPEMLRIIREVKPYAVLFENVPGFPSLNDGAEFKYLLRTLAEMGFNAEWGHLRASDSGAPHQRERWFCVAYTSSGGWQNIKRDHRQERQNNPIQNGQYTPPKSEGVRFWDGVGTGGESESLADSAGIRREHDRTGSQQDRFQQGWSSKLARGNQTELADTYNAERQTRSSYGMGTAKPTKSLTRGRRMGNATSAGLERANGRKPSLRKRTRPGTRAIESRFRGTLNGFPSWVDFPGWPARPGEDQYAYEPSRVTSAKTPDRSARLKALGNAVVPQVAYPLFAAIHEWLTALDADTVAA